jgi:hypothetical protein
MLSYIIDFLVKNKREDIKAQIGIISELYDDVKQLTIERICRLNNSNVICQNRTQEGHFINKSLADMRLTIQEMLAIKNKDAISIVPNFINECSVSYCPRKTNCFAMEKPKGKYTINSVLMQHIKSGLSDYKDKDDSELAKALLIGVFCVFNISRSANNPPHTPYVDINELKRMYYNKTILDNLEEFKNHATTAIEFIEANGVKLADLLTKKEYIHFIYLMGLVSIINKRDIPIPTVTFPPEWSSIDHIALDKYGKTILGFLTLIDNNNAVTAIGTLEFVDQLTKYNTVNHICMESHIEDTLKVNIIPKKGGSNPNQFKELKEIIKPKW